MSSIDVRAAIPKRGWLEGWLKYIEPYEFPESYGLFALLACASAAIDRRILVNPEGEPEVYTNTYTILLGPAGARKGSAIRRAFRMLAAGYPDAPTLPRSFTMSAATRRLVEKSDPDNGDGKGSGFIVSHEFTRLIGDADYMRENVTFFTDIWDSDDPFTRETIAHDYQVIHQPYITLLASVQPDFLENADATLFSLGFLRRLLIITEHMTKKFASEPHHDKVLFTALAKLFSERMYGFDHTQMELTKAAKAVKKKWYEKVCQPIMLTGSEKEAQFGSCMEAHALKLGAVVSVLEYGEPSYLDGGALLVGQGLVESILPSMFQAYRSLAATPGSRLRSAIVRQLEARGGRMKEIDLDRALMDAKGVEPIAILQAKTAMITYGYIKRSGEWLTLPSA